MTRPVSSAANSRTRPLVTIAIPTFNRAATTLPHTLNSAMAQRYENLEIIVSDNCSTDHTPAYVGGFADPRIRYVRQLENVGLNNNLNRCIDAAQGAYVLLLHDDDLIDPDFIDVCMDAVHDSVSVGLIRTGVRIIDANGATLTERRNCVTGTSMADQMFAWYRRETSIYSCNTLLNTQALRDIGGMHSIHDLFQDTLAHIKIAVKYGSAQVQDVKASWRRHGQNAGSATRARIQDWCEDSLQLLDTICALDPGRSAGLRAEGLPFLCTMNYTYVPRIQSMLGRLSAYLLVARKFSFATPVVPYIYKHEVRPHVRSLKRRFVNLLTSPAT